VHSQTYREKTQYSTLVHGNDAKNLIGLQVHSDVVANQSCLPQELG